MGFFKVTVARVFWILTCFCWTADYHNIQSPLQLKKNEAILLVVTRMPWDSFPSHNNKKNPTPLFTDGPPLLCNTRTNTTFCSGGNRQSQPQAPAMFSPQPGSSRRLSPSGTTTTIGAQAARKTRAGAKWRPAAAPGARAEPRGPPGRLRLTAAARSRAAAPWPGLP